MAVVAAGSRTLDRQAIAQSRPFAHSKGEAPMVMQSWAILALQVDREAAEAAMMQLLESGLAGEARAEPSG